MASSQLSNGAMSTRIIPVEGHDLGHFDTKLGQESLDVWMLPQSDSPALHALQDAAELLKRSIIPVAFPTETVYGLGADATRSGAVKGIYKAKGRPSDNPLIIHVSDLAMLRFLLLPHGADQEVHDDPIPPIYKPLIHKFWPGPLTILLPNPAHSKLAPEVTAGLQTVGVRMPDSPLALTLIKLAGVPIAAPSANASTKPSPTTAEHVLYDLNGKIEVILDGGPCDVGVESTVVDGLCNPPVVLRPGGLSIDSIRSCPGWEGVLRGYKDESELGSEAPRAPGMKYKHYSPKAKVVLCDKGANVRPEDVPGLFHRSGIQTSDGGVIIIGLVRTRTWVPWAGWDTCESIVLKTGLSETAEMLETRNQEPHRAVLLDIQEGQIFDTSKTATRMADVIEIQLGTDTKSIAHGLFSALRELDRKNVDIIYVEGIEDEGDIAAAVMNRLRKAATDVIY